MRLDLALLLSVFLADAAIPFEERHVLQNLYKSTKGQTWRDIENWNDAPGTECNWYGVQCDPLNETVVGLVLPTNNLQGNLPYLRDLSSLENLNMFGNVIIQSLTGIRDNFALRHIDFSNNDLSGNLDFMKWEQLVNLTTLTLYDIV
mmetsp:Transcript_13162/g.37358  ORF Transcript_13162/g.37358 Transcript_13162/m.37358 type:complete len:147 (+) Transcript_13162:77-517(+)